MRSDIGAHSVPLPPEMLSQPQGAEDSLASWALQDAVAVGLRCVNAARTPADLEALRSRAILAPKNDVVNEINDKILASFPEQTVVQYTSADTIAGGTMGDYSLYPVEFLNSVDLPSLAPHTLRLCPGAVIILLRNLEQSRGLCNGARAVVIHCRQRVLDVLLLTGQHAGSRFFVPRIPMTSEATALPFRLQRRQFPVRLAWAMTINKAQGQSFSRVGILLRNAVFAHGRLYVALSRAGSLALLLADPRSTMTIRILGILLSGGFLEASKALLEGF